MSRFVRGKRFCYFIYHTHTHTHTHTQINLVIGDITTDSCQEELINTTIAKFGKLDILINNAGINLPNSSMITGSMETFDKIMNTNLRRLSDNK
jgi:NAD(P)-dependent dehydrogenase (short-subunit alcohol dehydrogenase family)